MTPSKDLPRKSGGTWLGGTGAIAGFTSSNGDGGLGCGTCACCTGSVSLGFSLGAISSFGGSGSGVCGAGLGGGGGGTGLALWGAAACGSGDGPVGGLIRGDKSAERMSRIVLVGFGSICVRVSRGMINGVTRVSVTFGRGGCIKVSGITITNTIAAAWLSRDNTAERLIRAFLPGSDQSVNR